MQCRQPVLHGNRIINICLIVSSVLQAFKPPAVLQAL
jgi:hypothetical protein